MNIERRFLLPRTEAAAIAQMASNLEAEGYAVREHSAAEFEGRCVSFDLEAQRGDERIFYEVKVVGGGASSGKPALSTLADVARGLGARFQLVVVRPERGVEVRVPGLEAALGEALRHHESRLFAGLGRRVAIKGVSGAEIARIELTGTGAADISGSAVIHVVPLAANEGSVGDFPFEFSVRLGSSGRVDAEPSPSFEVDLSSWFGDDLVPSVGGSVSATPGAHHDP